MDPFETERLIVRQFTELDGNDFFLLNSNEKVVQYIRPPKNRAESDDFLAENLNLYFDGFPYGRMHVSEKLTGKFIGTFSLLYLDGDADYHIGYALLPEHWGKGYASELVKYGTAIFFNRTKHSCLFAITNPENLVSETVLYKNGYHQSGEYLLDQKPLHLFQIQRTFAQI